MRDRLLSYLLGFGIVLLMSLRGAAAGDTFDIISIENPSPNVEIVHIRQPNVKQEQTAYPRITFAPGDAIVVSASGCVQTGGHGSTWKRYVNPSGSDSDRYYFGEIWIPGATGVMVPIAGVVGKTLNIATGTPAAGLFLRLGYADDDYSDNGYYSHDDGTENQCGGADGGAAEVTLSITHAAKTTNPTGDVAPFDLFWNQIDANAIPLQARWGEQLNHDRNPASHPTGLAGDDICATPWLLPCTTQAPSLDNASFPNSWVSCDRLGGPLNGHVNWGPGTYSGTLDWESKSDAGADDDYSINLATSNHEGATEGRPEGYHTEFDSDETIDHFGSPWWNSLRHAVDNENTFPTPADLLNNKVAIVTGLVDLDCAHPCSGELHPVYAMAVRAIGDKLYEQWAIFVRNWGNEGGCSSQNHELLLDNNQYSLLIPWPPGATSVAFGNQTSFYSNDGAVTISVASIVPGVGTELTFNLPNPDAQPLVDGLLELTYAGKAPGPALPPVRPQVRASLSSVLAPALFSNVVKTEDDQFPPMTAAQLGIFRTNLPPATQRPNALKIAMPAPRVMTAAAWNAERQRRRPSTVPVIRSVQDTGKLARDVVRVKALYAAFDGNVPGFGPLPPGPGLAGRPLPSPVAPIRP